MKEIRFIPFTDNIDLTERICLNDENEVIVTDINGQPITSNGLRRKKMPFSLFKYLAHQYSKNALCCKTQYLTFVSPNMWEDPFEYALYGEELLPNDKKLFCFCASFSRSLSEEAFWKRYDPHFEGKYVMWSINFVSLLNALSRLKDIHFFVAPIDYSYSKEDIKKLLKKRPSSLTETIARLTIKRKAFAHENEMRIFAVVDKNCQFIEGELLKLPVPLTAGNYNNRVLTKIVLPPFRPRRKGEISDNKYAVMQHLMNQDKRKFYMKLGYTRSHEIEQSHLFEINNPCASDIKNWIAAIK